MVRTELIQLMTAINPDLQMRDIERIIDVFFDEIAERLAKGGRVELRGFGVFSARERNARKSRNPRNGDPVAVPPKQVPFFRCGKEMHQRLNID